MKPFTSSLRTRIATFTRSEDGSALTMVGLATLVLLASAGIAIDLGRVQVVQSRLSNALDAAGLAAGAVAYSGDINATALKYFNANYPSGYMGSVINPLTVVPNADNSLLVLDVQGTVPTTFMKLFGVNSVDVSAHSEITRANKGMELVLVIDVTGSMDGYAGGGLTKLQAAKNASTDLVNILYGDQTELENLWIGMVPFAQAVNIGTAHANWTVTDTFNWGPTSWMGCVDAREAGGQDVTETPPNPAVPSTLFPKYYWPCDGNNGWNGNNSSHTDCDTWGSFGYYSPLTTNRGPNKYCSQAVTPMTSNKNIILNDIASLTADGNTHIVLGAVWGWRMLSPQWRYLWGGEMDTDDLPQDYNTPLMNKVMILMSDGDNTISNGTRGAYWYLSNGKLGTTNQNNAETQLNNRTAQVCTSMKNNGILIYTIAFGTSIGSTAQTLLQNCASNPQYYFYSPTASDLQSAFHTIADSLANLRVSQ